MTFRSRYLATAALLAALAGPAMAADYLVDASRLIAAGDLPAARLQLRNAVKADPKNPTAHYRLGLINLQLGDPAAAEKEARTARDQGDDSAPTLSLLTTAYLYQGRYRDLLRDFPAGQGASQGEAAAAAVARGKAQMLLDHPDQAEASFAEAREMAPRSTLPMLAEAQLAIGRGDLAAASQKVDAVLEIDPASAEALQQQAVLRAGRGDRDGAIAAADKSVAAAPGQFSYRLERAGVLVTFNQNDLAKQDVDAVLALSPGSARALYYRAVLQLRAGDFAAANANLDKLSSFVSQYPGAYFVQALVKQKVGQTEQALDAANRYAARNPGDVRGALLLADLQLQSKHPDKAIEALTPSAEAGTDNPAVYDLRGTAFSRLGRLPEALRDFQKALTLRPDDPALLARTGATQLALNQTGAASLLERSVSLAPAQASTETLLAVALLEAGKYDEAQLAVDKLRTQQGGTEAVEVLAGAVQLAKFNLPDARQAFEAVLHDHPESTPARLSLARVALLQGHTDEWAKLTNEILQREPAREALVNEMVAQDIRQGRTADAVGVLERAHAAAPNNPRFTSRLANLYVTAGTPDKALELVSQADAADVPAMFLKADVQVALKQLDAAADTYRQILAADGRLVFARMQLVRLALENKDVAGAQAVLREGLQADPQNEQYLRSSVEVDAKGSAEAAAAGAAKLSRDPAHLPASLVLPGDFAMQARNFDQAAKDYAGPFAAGPTSRLALRLATARSAGGHPDTAAQGLRDWLAGHPDDLDAKQALSDMEINARHLAPARTLLTDLVAKRPEDARALNNLAWVAQQSKDPQAAVLARRAYQLAPGAETADTWGYILATEGGGDHGVGLLRLATLQAPADPAMQYHLAVALKASGQPDEAVKLLTPLVAAPAEFAEKQEAKQLLTTLTQAKP